MNYLNWAREFFKEDIYATETTGINIDQADKDYAKCSLEILPKHKNAAGSVMGGAIFTLADFTFAVAANVDNPVTVSVSSSISYVGAAKGNTLFCEAVCVKSGKSTCTFILNISDNLGNAVATVTTTGFRKR